MIRPGGSKRFLGLSVVIIMTVALMPNATRPARATSLPDASAAYARGDYMIAAKRLGRQAVRGNARAQGLLGFMYEYGRGVPQDYVLAAEWYIRGAEQGDPAAQYLLGLMYDKGRGVPQDAVLAHKWLILAAARAGHRDRDASIKLRDAVATKMSEAQIALAQHLAREWRSLRER